MSGTVEAFDKRLKRIEKNKARMREGYVGQVSKDGLIVFRPKRRRTVFSVRGLALVVLGFVAFKALIMAHLGPNTYQSRIDTLSDGTVVEQAGAFLMQPDPATQMAAAKLRTYLN